MTKRYLELDGFVTGEAPVRYGFFGRRGGSSKGVYESLNCGLATDDPFAAANREIVAQDLGGHPARLQTVYQVHGPTCVYMDAPVAPENRPKADAMVTDRPGLILGVLTADCGPVLFYGPKADGSMVVGAAHAGWKGALGGILESTVAMMCEYGAQLPEIRAAVGPCIAQKSYEVSIGFEEPFLSRDRADEIFFKQSMKDDKLLFDLSGYIAKRLAACGVRRVTLADVDTVANTQDYFSYRRATLSGEADNGRQMSAITTVI